MVLLRRVLIVAWIVVVALVGNAGASHATSLAVTRMDDPVPDGCLPSDCSLREAILEANQSPGLDTIVLPAGIFQLQIPGSLEDASASGDLDITDDLAITGAAATNTVIDAGRLDRAFDVAPEGQTITVALSGLSIRHGRESDGAGVRQQGGALTLQDVVVMNNEGAGVVSQSSGSALTLQDVMVTDNQGSGVISQTFGSATSSLTLTNVIISRNQPHPVGAGLIALSASVAMRSSHLDDNLATGFFNDGSTTTVEDTTFDRNDVSADTGFGGAGIVNVSELSRVATLELTGVEVNDNASAGATAGIANLNAKLTITRSIIHGNHAAQSAGALLNYFNPVGNGGPRGVVSILQSDISDNSAAAGGAISNMANMTIDSSTLRGNQTSGPGGAITSSAPPDNPNLLSDLHIVNSTITGNTSNETGGGIAADKGHVDILNSTIAGNSAADGAGIFDGPDGDVTLQNTILANDGANCASQVAIASGGGNISSDASCSLVGPSDVNSTDPLVGPLAYNGGATLTQALLDGSPAVDIGVNCPPPATDQRGLQRPTGVACDAGSFEVGSVTSGYLRWGDFTCDGLLDTADLHMLLRDLVGLPLTLISIDCRVVGQTVVAGGIPRVLGDLNCDGSVSAIDVLYELRAIVLAGLREIADCPSPKQFVLIG